jgi:hypothetical protein
MSQTGGKELRAATADDGLSYTSFGSADEAKHIRNSVELKPSPAVLPLRCRTAEERLDVIAVNLTAIPKS